MDEKTGTITRRNEGFNAFELIGLLKMTENDLIRQLNHESASPVNVIKEYVTPEEK
jgi:hypothetical protein